MFHLLSLTLNNTKCVNKLNSTYGTTYTRSNGLPQEAISSPLLFNLFVNDLIKQWNDTTITVLSDMNLCLNNLFFADDIALLAPSVLIFVTIF